MPDLTLAVAEAVAVAESPGAFITKLTMAVSDAVSVGEAVAVSIVVQVGGADSVGVAESVGTDASLAVSDPVSVSESVAAIIGTFVRPLGIATGEAFGGPLVNPRGGDLLLLPSSIASLLTIGSPSISNSGPTTIRPAGIPAP